MSSVKNQEHYYRQIFKLGQIITSETNLDRLFPIIMEQIKTLMNLVMMLKEIIPDGETHI